MTRALVLGGGGVTGIAWETGVLFGLAEAGYDATGWDLVVGTSAGSVVGSRLLGGGDLAESYARDTAEVTIAEDELVSVLGGRIGAMTFRAGRRPQLAWAPNVWVTISTLEAWVRRRARPPRPPALLNGAAGVRRIAPADAQLARLGSLAVSARTASARRFVEIVGDTIAPATDWPEPLVVTSIDVHDGSIVAFGRASGLPLRVAVAASSAVPVLFPTIPALGRRWMDGGMASTTHAQLAAGHDEVLIISPIPSRSQEEEVAELRAAGHHVTVVNPGPEAAIAMGNGLALLDQRRRPDSARAGFADGTKVARDLILD